jgi:hypothetical protein
MALDGLLPAAAGNLSAALAKVHDELLHARSPTLVLLTRLNVGLENRHELSLPLPPLP